LENNSSKPTPKQIKLLNALISDQNNAPDIYKPSPHWIRRSLAAVREIEKNGLNGFRSSTDINTAAAVYGDASVIDYRRLVDTSSIINRLGLAIIKHTPLKLLFDAQVNATRDFVTRLIELQKNALTLSNYDRLTNLIKNYQIENTINFGCDRTTILEDKIYSRHYLENLDILDFVEKNQTLKNSNSFLEIGPGYGTLIHLIEQNYPNIRKFIAVDIVPNVWVVTEYLRSHYGDCVKDYLETREMKEIKFKDDDSLEIFVIPSWQIENISSSIDCFWNSISFIEMSTDIVANYAEKIAAISTNKSIYNFIDGKRPIHKLTFESNLIPSLFPQVNFQMLEHLSLLEGDAQYFYFGKPAGLS
jgi:putative sugar O-methyltransferase